MITTGYKLCLLAALCVGMLLTALGMRRRGLKPLTAVIAIPVCAVTGVGGAWLLYKVLMFNTTVSAFDYCFIGGVLGVVLGLVLAAKALGQSIGESLDAAAAPLCLAVCMARLGEYFIKYVGWGRSMVGNGWYYRAPFAVSLVWDDYYEEWSGYAAVFMLEALLALLAFVVALLIYNRVRTMPGLVFERAMYLLLVPQIFSEQLRSMPMTWGFVRVEQILSALLAAVILGRSCYVWMKQSKASAVKAWWPVGAIVLLAGIIVISEFALDGKIELSNTMSYVLFIGSLTGMLALEEYAVHRRVSTK